MILALPLIISVCLQVTLPNRILAGTASTLQPKDSLDYKFPYMVSIRRAELDELLGYSQHICGGSLINNRTVVTAAHCLFDKFDNYLGNENTFTVVAGTKFNSTDMTGSVSRKAKRIVANPKYSMGSPDGDIAVLILDKELAVDGIRIGVIEHASRQAPEGSVCGTLGWINTFANSSPILQTNKTLIANKHACVAKYGTLGVNVTKNHLCAFPASFPNSAKNCSEGEIALGRQNSGEILVCNGKLIGISSFGNECNLVHYPQVFTDITSYRDFLLVPENDTYLPQEPKPAAGGSLAIRTKGNLIIGLLFFLVLSIF